MNEELKHKQEKNPLEFSNAIYSMLSKFEGMKTDAGLLSAMHNFGKIQYETIVAGNKSTSIPVQRTSLSRRKRITGSRRCQPSGRPSKVSFTAEHGIIKERGKQGICCQLKEPKLPILFKNVQIKIFYQENNFFSMAFKNMCTRSSQFSVDYLHHYLQKMNMRILIVYLLKSILYTPTD